NANGQSITIQQPGQIIALKKTDPFGLKPGDRTSQPINLSYPSSVKSGKYTLTVELKDQDGTSHGISSQQIDLTGTNRFIEIVPSDCKIKVGSNTFSTTEGPEVPKNQTAILSCTVKNSSNQTIQGKAMAVYAVNSIGDASSTQTL